MAGEPTNLPKIKLSKALIDVLEKLNDMNEYIAFEILCLDDEDTEYFNGLKITNVDVSDKDFHFKVTTKDKGTVDMKCGNFIRYYFHNYFTSEDIQNFVTLYNKVKKGESVEDEKIPIKVPTFEYNPLDPRSTFLSLVTKTYPHGHEDEVLQFLPELSKDIVGNYYKIIGDNPTTMFTCHLDTADRKQAVTRLFSVQIDEQEHIVTDGTTVLGADDKAGTTVMLYMMAKNVPGLYYFFIGEERGGIGSRALADKYDEVSYLKNIKRCVSFDRRKTISVITAQAGGRCCSDEFGNALCEQYNASGLNLKIDPTGVFTDSASFIDDIPECTNVSVGYLNEHTGKEIQNMDYLIDLCKASVNVDWANLPVVRTIQDRAAIKQMISNVKTSNKEFVDALKGVNLDKTISTDHGNVYVNFDLENEDIDTILESLKELRNVMKLHKRPTSCLFDETYLQIILGKDSSSKTNRTYNDPYESNKLKKYDQFLNEEWDRWNDEEEEDDDQYEDDDNNTDDIDNLKYLLRKMITQAGIKNCEVTNTGMNLKVQIIPTTYGMVNYFYKLDEVIHIYEVIKKIDKDVLIDFDLECDIWETRKVEPLFIFNFYSMDDGDMPDDTDVF
jgi:hypothetical protein